MRLPRPILFLFSMVAFAACNTGIDSINKGKTVFRYNESFPITSLDPAFTRSIENIWGVNQLFNGLVQLDEQLKVQPCIARGWTVSEDGKEYTFHLRSDVKFHDHELFPKGQGRRVVASDFIYSFLRILDPSIASPGSWVFNAVVDSNNYRDGFVALDDTTFKIKLSMKFPPFLGLLSMQYCSVVPKEIVSHYTSDFRNHPVGTGPFQFKFWKEGEKLVLLKNPDYFETYNGKKLPFLDAVAVSFIKDRQSAFLEFVKGNFDFISGIDGSFKDDVVSKDGSLQEKYKGKFLMKTQPYLMTHYIGFLLDEKSSQGKTSPLLNKKVRQAINCAINRKKMITYLRNNIGNAANAGFVPLGMPSFDSLQVKGWSFNPEKAQDLMREAGYNESNPCPSIQLYTSALYSDMCEFVQNELRKIGIKTSVEVASSATLNEMIAQSSVNFFRKSWSADYADAENYLALFYSKNFSPGGPNYTHFSNSVYDKLYEKALSETDTEKRYKLYRQMDSLLVEEAPIVNLYYDVSVHFLQKSVQNFAANPLNLLNLKKVRKQYSEDY